MRGESTGSLQVEADAAPADRLGPPRPLLSRRAERELGPRHREVLDALESLFLEHGFSAFTVRELAAGVGCSRRTLYEIAASKDELVLIVLDRFLHRVGRSALTAIDPEAPVAEQIRAYYRGGSELQRQTQLFAEDLAEMPAARRLLDHHFRYVMQVLEELVRAGVETGEFRRVTPGVAAGVLAGSGLFLGQPQVAADLGAASLTGNQVTDEVLDLVLGALVREG